MPICLRLHRAGFCVEKMPAGKRHLAETFAAINPARFSIGFDRDGKLHIPPVIIDAWTAKNSMCVFSHV